MLKTPNSQLLMLIGRSDRGSHDIHNGHGRGRKKILKLRTHCGANWRGMSCGGGNIAYVLHTAMGTGLKSCAVGGTPSFNETTSPTRAMSALCLK